MLRCPRSVTAAALSALAVATAGALAAPAAAEPPPGGDVSRLVVHFADGTAADSDDRVARAEVAAVGRGSGHALAVSRRLSTDGVLVELGRALDTPAAQRLVDRFLARDGVVAAEVDAVMTATAVPNDLEYGKQWHYSEPLGGANLPSAWDASTGTGVVVAVLDTGITAHPDLDANVVAGYDFVSSATAARDGDGRDANPLDQGDWYARNECGKGVPASRSSWHGTHVAGTVAAVTGNASGVAGVAFGSKVQPVRVLAKCGGSLSDIADAITWASGGSVPNVPANPTPAKVVNMSLGGGGTCGATYQRAIDGAVARGTTVVVAAGNSAANAGSYQPSSCQGVVVVAANDREGNRASYSNYGAVVDVTAPGGETAVAGNGVLSTLNTGATTPASPTYAYYQGTSMATPHVAGLAALVLARTALTPAQLETRLKSGTRPLPGSCTGGCGAGIVDAAKTLALT